MIDFIRKIMPFGKKTSFGTNYAAEVLNELKNAKGMYFTLDNESSSEKTYKANDFSKDLSVFIKESEYKGKHLSHIIHINSKKYPKLGMVTRVKGNSVRTISVTESYSHNAEINIQSLEDSFGFGINPSESYVEDPMVTVKGMPFPETYTQIAKHVVKRLRENDPNYTTFSTSKNS